MRETEASSKQSGLRVPRIYSGVVEEAWLALEDEVGIERLDGFFGHYRTSLSASKARGSLYEEMEPLIRVTEGGPFWFLEKANQAAEHYERIVDGDFSNVVSLQSIRALRRVEYDEWIPPLLAFMSKPVQGLTETEFINLLERITTQNWVRRLGRTARLTVYYQLINAIKDGKAAGEIRDIFVKNAQNEEFLALLGGELYGKPFDAAVLLRLEEASQDESVTRTYSGQITIEHVMPQALKDDYWRTRFTEVEHALWLHRLGNLALLSGRKNYKAQYYSFDRKKQIYSGFQETKS